MNRRTAMKLSGTLVSAFMLGDFILYTPGCKSVAKPFNKFYNGDDVNLFDEISSVIIPTTDSPGAKEAGTGSFIATMLADCFSVEERKIAVEGIIHIDAMYMKTHSI